MSYKVFLSAVLVIVTIVSVNEWFLKKRTTAPERQTWHIVGNWRIDGKPFSTQPPNWEELGKQRMRTARYVDSNGVLHVWQGFTEPPAGWTVDPELGLTRAEFDVNWPTH